MAGKTQSCGEPREAPAQDENRGSTNHAGILNRSLRASAMAGRNRSGESNLASP
jgi:hypothetical protein